MKYVTILLLLPSCAASDPQFTSKEMDCLVAVKLERAAEIARCGDNVSGDCSTDAIFDRALERSTACLSR